SAARKAVTLAREQGGIVVAVGGDGTLNAVCQAVVGQGVPFGVLPQGTFNYFGRAHGISQDTGQAMHDLLNARLEHISLGQINGRYFLVNASLGLYPQLLEDREEYKQRYGRSRWIALVAALVTLARAHRQLDITLEHGGRHERLRTPTLVVCNNALQLKHIGVDPALPDNRDHLVALASRPVGTGALYLLLLQGLLSRMGEAENVISFGFENLTVRPNARPRMVKVAVDGEILRMRTPLTFRIAPHVLPLLIPRSAPTPEHPCPVCCTCQICTSAPRIPEWFRPCCNWSSNCGRITACSAATSPSGRGAASSPPPRLSCGVSAPRDRKSVV